MEKKYIIGIAFAILLIILIVFNIFSLKSVKPTSFQITNVGIDENRNILFEGIIGVENPSLLNAHITEIEYEIILEKTNETIAQGTIEGQTIPRKTTTNFLFSQPLDWMPDTKTGIELMNQEKIYIIIQGKAHAKLLWVFPVSSSFDAKIDVGTYVRNVIQQQVDSMMGALGALLR